MIKDYGNNQHLFNDIKKLQEENLGLSIFDSNQYSLYVNATSDLSLSE
ncbi:16812_t:CDS:1, partial [Dentiscutata heterogama]